MKRVPGPEQAIPAAERLQPLSSSLEALQTRLGYPFTQPALLELALTHSSFVYEARLGRARSTGDEPNEPGTDNEQLEFLGAAVLGLRTAPALLSRPHRRRTHSHALLRR